MQAKTKNAIICYAQEVLDIIVEFGLQEEFDYEMNIAQEVIDQAKMDSSQAQREYLTAEYFYDGSTTLPKVRSQVTREINKRVKRAMALAE